MAKFDHEIVSGSILRSVWKVAWPVIITQMIAGIHGIVDQILVGHYVGYEAQAGIGVSWQLFLVILVFLSSLFHGMNILIARYAGRQDAEAVNRITFQVLITSVYLLLFVFAPAGYLLSPYLLDLMNTEPAVHDQALPYLRLLFTTSSPLFLMFLLNGAFQSSGNPKIPLMLGLLTTLVKVSVSFLLITGAGFAPALGATGAAIGTCVGPLPSVIIGFSLIRANKLSIGLPEHVSLIPDWNVIRSVARIGLPSGIQAVLLNIGGAVLLRYIGSLPYSAEAQAAFTICYSQLFSFVTWTGFGLRAACATVIGQNIGAGEVDRGQRAVYLGAAMGFAWAAVFGALYWFFPEALLGAFGVHEGQVFIIASELLRFLTFSGVFVVVALAFTGGLQGAGDTKRPMFIAFVTQIVILLGICAVFDQMGRLTNTVIWSSILIAHATRLVLSYAVFLRGKWKEIRVELEDRRVPLPEESAEQQEHAAP